MPTVPSGFVNQAKVAEAVRRAEKALRPEVVRIRYSFENDWTGDPSIFFRVVLSDKASRPAHLGEVTERIEKRLMNEVRSDEFGLHSYFNFRSKTEQEEIQEPAWA